MDELRLLSWNLLRHDSYRPYAWPTMLRRQALIHRLPQVDCDLACFQEVSRDCLPLLRRLRPELAWHPGRVHPLRHPREELLPIAWRRDRFTLLAHGGFRLGRCPPGPERRRELPRPCSWLRLRAAGGSRLLLANTHLGHDPEHRQRDARLLGERLAELGRDDDAVLLAGDFNSRPDDPVFRILAEHGLQRMPQRPRSLGLFGLPLLAIDAICSRGPRCLAVERISGRSGLVYASDHFGLLATLA